MKNRTIAILLCLLGFLGISGIQHLYLRKPLKAFLWFFTLGFVGIGTLIDLFTIGNQVDTHNLKLKVG